MSIIPFSAYNINFVNKDNWWERSSATQKSSPTNFGPSPKYFWIGSLPTTRRNGMSTILDSQPNSVTHNVKDQTIWSSPYQWRSLPIVGTQGRLHSEQCQQLKEWGEKCVELPLCCKENCLWFSPWRFDPIVFDIHHHHRDYALPANIYDGQQSLILACGYLSLLVYDNLHQIHKQMPTTSMF